MSEEEQLWRRLIDILIDGMTSFSAPSIYYQILFSTSPTFEREVFGDCGRDISGEFTCTKSPYSIPKWETLNVNTWKLLCEFDERYSVMRLLYV